MDITSLQHEQQQLRDDLMSLIDNLNQDNKHKNTFNHSLKSFDFIITHCEVNDRQGVGVLVKRIFADSSQVISLRSHNLYEGQQSFGESHYCLSYQKSSRAEILETVYQTFSHKTPKRILCIPYYPDDMVTAIALKDIFKVPLCTYIMDDQNIYVNNISDELTRELIVKSDFCLGISRDLCKAYQQKYKKKFWFLPPVAPQSLIDKSKRHDSTLTNHKKGIIVGNIWSQKWLDRLLKITAQSDIEIDWYANPNRDWLKFDEQELSRSGIHLKGYLPETQLAPTLKKVAFALIPTAASDDISERVEIAKLSLPSRIPFIVATSHTPLIVMGNSDTAAAHFVESFKLGKVCGYDAESFNQAISWITLPENQQTLRQKAADLAPKLSSEAIAEWIWQSLAQGKPIDLRFENLGKTLSQATVIITVNEVNQQHGTGALVRRIVGDTSNIISIRSDNHYGGQHDFGEISLCLPKIGITRLQAYEFIQEHLKGSSVKQILCVPYCPDELRLAIAVKDLYDVALATYIMDDQNISVNNIPDDLMREFLTKCSLRFATHPELRDAYENKYGLEFWLLPAVAPYQYLNTKIALPKSDHLQEKTGALLGSIWSAKWFKMLGQTVKGANLKLDWFGNTNYWWLQQSPEELAQTTGITPFGLRAERELAEKLRDYPYIVVPTGTLDERDDCQNLSQLSLPGRIIFALVSSNTPIIILGSQTTGAAHFVKRFGIGLTCDYDGQAFRKVVDQITQPDVQKEMRRNATKIAENFSDKGIKDWLWQSLHNGQPTDRRFENLLPRTRQDDDLETCDTFDFFVTLNEMNEQHGTGVLVNRLFKNASSILTLRSVDHYGGKQVFGNVQLRLSALNQCRSEIEEDIIKLLGNKKPKRILCIPFFPDECLAAITLKDIFNVPLCTYVMDDQNIYVNNIPNELMKELLDKSDLCLGISRDLCEAYEGKYHQKFWFLPPVAPQSLIRHHFSVESKLNFEKKGIIIGNIWSQTWLDKLAKIIAQSDVEIYWYGKPNRNWLKFDEQELSQQGIHFKGYLRTEEDLVSALSKAAFALIPTAESDDISERIEIAKLSLPSRIPFIVATSHTPIIIMGSPDTGAAHFVETFKLGKVCQYDTESFSQIVSWITLPENQKVLRQNAADLAPSLSSEGVADWIWQSLYNGHPIDLRFEDLLPRAEDDIVHYIEAPVPRDIYKDYVPVYQVMRRLYNKDYRPNFIVDVGSSSGVWSYTTSQFFSDAHFILIDPLMSKHQQVAKDFYLQQIPNATLLEVTVSNQSGTTTFQVSPDLYGSSLLNPADYRTDDTVTVDVLTLDKIAKTYQLTGRGMLKLDVQCAKHIVLEGAKQLLEQVDAIVFELSLVRYDDNALVLTEMLNLLDELGFRYYDETGDWRSPVDGTLLQKEIVFLRHNLLVFQTSSH